jgi:hypothetical protein
MDQLSGAGLTKFKGSITYDVALAIQGVIKPYKRKHSGPVIWPSEKARRFYFAMRRKAGLPMKYTRGSDPMSQRLQQSWTVERRPTSATLGNRATYAPYVASDEFQTEQHAATGFTTDKQAAEKVQRGRAMRRIIDANIKAMMDAAFKGLK